MKNRIAVWLAVTAVVLALFWAAGSAIAGPSKGDPGSAEGVRVAGTVASRISYQGRLTDPAGNPLSGSYNLKFELYDAVSGGSRLWEQTLIGLPVQNGLFTALLEVDQTDFTGQGLWLAITVNGQLLSPRQEIVPAPYALSLRPGALVKGSVYAEPVLKVENTDPNPAGGGYAIVGVNASGNMWRPAIYGENTGASAGIYGYSKGWHATVGWQAGSNPDFAGVYGHNAGAGPGVKGIGPTGVYGESNADGGQGVHGHGTAYLTEGVIGTADGRDGAGVYARANGSGGLATGVEAESTSSYAVYGDTFVSGGYGFYTPDKIYTGGGCIGCTSMLIAKNGGEETLELGDVVMATGIAAPLSPQTTRPVIVVRKADAASAQAVVGVVEGHYIFELASGKGRVVESARTTEEPAVPGEYLTVVYRGLARVKVDATRGAIKVGDPLAVANSASHAMRAQALNAAPGSIIGKAMESLEMGQRLMWVLLDIQ